MSVLDGSNRDTIYALEKDGQSKWMITACTLSEDSEKPQQEANTVLKGSNRLRSLTVSSDARFAIAATDGGLMIGTLDDITPQGTDIKYVWQEVTLEEPVTCFSMQCRRAAKPKSSKARKANAAQSQQNRLDLVIGTVRGRIYLYTDFMRHLEMRGRANGQPVSSSSLSPRVMHWHREAVCTVKFSHDGAYIQSTL